jgi:RNA polymerase sigma-70 factor (ECF subfamily)
MLCAEIVEAARAAWPGVELPAERFLAYLGDRVPSDVPFERALRELHTSDLYLACGCVGGDPDAMAAFDLGCLSVIDRSLARLGLDGDAIAEIKQGQRTALLVADAGPPGITAYRGRGKLRRWVQVIAVNQGVALRHRLRRHTTLDDDGLFDGLVVGSGPEVGYLKRAYGRELALAFAEAVAELSDHDRTLLRQQFLDGLDVREIGKIYAVHRGTAGRWLERARQAVLANTRATLMRRLRIPPAELDAIIQLIVSDLDVSLRALFRQRRR